MPGKSKKGGGLKSSPVYKKTPFKMNGFSGFGNSPLKSGTWKGLPKTNKTKLATKQPTGVNKKIVDAVVNTVVPSSAAEAISYVGGAGVVRNLKNIGSKLYQAAKAAKTVKTMN